jgi:phytoene synthase
LPTPSRPDEPSGAAQLDDQVRKADPDRWLATRFIADPAARADVIALYAYDAELARAPRAASNTLMAEIRLTWWREVLDQIYAGEPVRRHPVAEALADTVGRHRLPRAPLEAMIDARIEVLALQHLGAEAAAAWADQVGGSAAALAAAILDPTTDAQATLPAGRAWGFALLRRAGKLPDTGPLKDALAAASSAVSVRAFPAIAHVALARSDLRSAQISELGKRLRLFWAVLRGRI